ncbi:MAG: isoprenylcysteine carboxylmethyltransferase family protein [Chloroflexi bacterium]|nr:isoprenylcysteine carboxylmethyltransferase family protein [Chloroflexota bacterium]
MVNKLRNFPIPEYHLALLVIGITLNYWSKTAFVFTNGIPGYLTGGIAIFIAVSLMIWAIYVFANESTEKPGSLQTAGPYRLTRNPMYLGWSLLLLGIGLLLGSWWLLIGVLLAMAITNFRVIPSEEKFLHDRFGDEFNEYTRSVRRWV